MNDLRKTILVIEDEDNIRLNLQDLLEVESFRVLTAADGRAGYQLAQVERPNLILCDIMMPELDGYQVLHHLQQDPTTARIPFIFLSEMKQVIDLRQGMILGADDYIPKPFTRQDLLAAIQIRLAKYEQFDQLEAQISVLQQVSLRKDEMLSTISHNLRASLTNMKIAIEMLSQAQAAEQHQRYLDILKAECSRELNLVNDLLDWQKQEAGAYRLPPEVLDLNPILRESQPASTIESKTANKPGA